MFLLNELLKSFSPSTHKKRVGFVLDVLPIPYSLVMASTRIRAYDVILAFVKDPDFSLELYRPGKRYDIVIFQKAWRSKHFLLAEKLRNKGTKVILDLNIVIFHQHKEVYDFIRFVDHLLVSSPYLLEETQKLFPHQSISLIEEHIPNQAFSVEKDTHPQPKVLVYAGYAQKAAEVLHIKNVLQSLRKKYNFSILFICEKNPEISIDGIECLFEKYYHPKIYPQVIQGDIFIAPRNLQDSANLAHSFSKIGLPMSVGVPVVASPVPAYKGSPALLCTTDAEWEKNLEILFKNSEERERISKAGQLYCRQKYSTKKIMQEYRDLFTLLMGKPAKPKFFQNPLKRNFHPILDRRGRAKFIATHFKEILDQSTSILDVGCSDNDLKDIVGNKVYGIDIGGKPDKFLDLEKECLSPFKDNQFNLSVCTEVLEHIDNLYEVLDDLCRVSENRVIISLPNCPDIWKTLRIFFTQTTGKFYGLPLEKPADRHKWFFSWKEIDRFFEYYAAKHNYHIEQKFLQYNYGSTRKEYLIRALLSIFPFKSFAQSYWIVLKLK